jgi:hypothetical protein
VARRVAPAHLARDVGCELEHLPVEQEEPREAEVADQRELLVEPHSRLSFVPVRVAVASVERAVADLRQLGDRGLVAVGEVRVAVAELLGEVELEPSGQLGGARDGVAVVGEALGDRVGREQDAFVVASALAFGALERRPVPDRDHRVLEERAPAVVRVDVAGDDGLHADRVRELPQPRVALRVAPVVRALELDEEPVAPEDRRQLGRAVAAAGRKTVARAAGQADEAFVVRRKQVPVEARRDRLRRLWPRSRVGGGQQPTEVRVPARGLDEQRDVRPVRQRHFRPGDRPHPERRGRVGELERPVDAVVIRERERLVAELRRARRKLLRVRGSVEERIG